MLREQVFTFIARALGFLSWPKLTHHIESLGESGSPVSAYEAAVAAIVSGDATTACLDLYQNEGIIAEPLGGAHREPAAAVAAVGAATAAALDELAALSSADLRAQRRDRFLAIGRFEAEAVGA